MARPAYSMRKVVRNHPRNRQQNVQAEILKTVGLVSFLLSPVHFRAENLFASSWDDFGHKN